MKKHAFLIPLAAAIAALTDSTYATVASKDQSATSKNPEASGISQHGASNSFVVQTSSDRADSFVLARSEDGLMFAAHESHSSHSSHASHASHASHTSSVSMA
jgi:hypothetical protein